MVRLLMISFLDILKVETGVGLPQLEDIGDDTDQLHALKPLQDIHFECFLLPSFHRLQG